MKLFRLPSPSMVVGSAALFLAVGGVAAASQNWSGSQQNVKQLIAQSTANNAKHLGGHDPQFFLQAKHVVSSGGERFFNVGQTVTLGKAGHFKFTASCKNPSGTTGAQQVTFDVVADTTAGLDGNPPQPAGNLVNIHTNSDALDPPTTR